MSNPRPDTWSERKKWTMGIVSALIVPALVGVGTVLFRPASEPIVIPKPYHEGSLCTGPWVFKTRDVCDDPDKPIFETIVDGEKCGWIERERTIQPEVYKRCRDPTHGVER